MSFFFMLESLIFLLKKFIWSFASLGQYLLLKFKNTCIKPEQSMPLKDFPPHLYFTPLNIKIFLNGSLFLKEISFKSVLLIQPSEIL